MNQPLEIEYKTFYGVSAAMLEDAWPAVWPLLQKVYGRTLAARYYNEYDIYSAIADRDMQLWVCVIDGQIKAALVTQIVVYPRAKTFDIVFVGGEEVDTWVEQAWEELKLFGQSHNCQFIRGFGRAGWQRKLKNEFQNSVVWECEL